MEKLKEVVSEPIDESGCKIGRITLNDVSLVTLSMNNEERVCLAQLSNTLLKDYSYNEIHNRCGMITKREAERLFNSFFNETTPPHLPADFVFSIYHECGWGCAGYFIPSKYNSSRAKCIRCAHCAVLFSPNKFIFHCHKNPGARYIHPDAANFNSWRRHIKLASQGQSVEVDYAWEDVKALFNGGSRKKLPSSPSEDKDIPMSTSSLSSSQPKLLTSPYSEVPTAPIAGATCAPTASSQFCISPYKALSNFNHLMRPLLPAAAAGSPLAQPFLTPISSPNSLSDLYRSANNLFLPPWSKSPHIATPFTSQFLTSSGLGMMGKRQASLLTESTIPRPESTSSDSSIGSDEGQQTTANTKASIKRPWVDEEIDLDAIPKQIRKENTEKA